MVFIQINKELRLKQDGWQKKNSQLNTQIDMQN